MSQPPSRNGPFPPGNFGSGRSRGPYGDQMNHSNAPVNHFYFSGDNQVFTFNIFNGPHSGPRPEANFVDAPGTRPEAIDQTSFGEPGRTAAPVRGIGHLKCPRKIPLETFSPPASPVDVASSGSGLPRNHTASSDSGVSEYERQTRARLQRLSKQLHIEK